MYPLLINGDCLEEMDKLEFKEESDKIDLVCVDLPYGQTKNSWDSLIDLEKMWTCLDKICKHNCIFLFFCTVKFGNSIINSRPSWFRYDIVWEKTNSVGFLDANIKPLRNHEMIYLFSRPTLNKKKYPDSKRTYNPQMVPGKPYTTKTTNTIEQNYNKKRIGKINITGDRYPKSIQKWSYDKKSHHPTQKPQDCLEWLIKTYSNENDLVLDFTMGSGSTGVACKTTNRRFIGIELTKEYFDVATNRLS